MPTDPASTAQNYGGASMQRLAGGAEDVTTGAPGAEGTPDQMATVTNTLRECSDRIMSVVGQNPKVAKEAREALAAIRRLAAAFVSNPGAGPEPTPRTNY